MREVSHVCLMATLDIFKLGDAQARGEKVSEKVYDETRFLRVGTLFF